MFFVRANERFCAFPTFVSFLTCVSILYYCINCYYYIITIIIIISSPDDSPVMKKTLNVSVPIILCIDPFLCEKIMLIKK